MRTPSELVDELQSHFSEPPTGATVLRQGFDYNPDQWIREGRWPASLAEPQFLSTHPTHVTRADVRQRAATVQTEADAVELYVMMAAWGTGTKARPVARVRKPLHQLNCASTLLKSLEHLRSARDAVDSYKKLRRGNEHHIKFFGPAFFTKWLYFAGADLDRPPLILDALVASAIGAKSTSGWSSGEYDQYLDLAGEVRDQWAPDQQTHVVEYALFKCARAKRSQP